MTLSGKVVPVPFSLAKAVAGIATLTQEIVLPVYNILKVEAAPKVVVVGIYSPIEID